MTFYDLLLPFMTFFWQIHGIELDCKVFIQFHMRLEIIFTEVAYVEKHKSFFYFYKKIEN